MPKSTIAPTAIQCPGMCTRYQGVNQSADQDGKRYRVKSKRHCSSFWRQPENQLPYILGVPKKGIAVLLSTHLNRGQGALLQLNRAERNCQAQERQGDKSAQGQYALP